MVKRFLKRRKDKVSVFAANKDLRHLNALFRWAIREKMVDLPENPAAEIQTYPARKPRVYVPAQEDIDRVISAVKEDRYLMGRHPDTEDYLHTIKGAVQDAVKAFEESRAKFTTDSRRIVEFKGKGKAVSY